MYSGDLKSRLVWISNSQKEVGLQTVWIWNGIWNPEAQPFEIWTNGCHLFKNYLKSGKKCPDFDRFGFGMVGTITIAIAKVRPFEIRPSKSPDFNFLDLKWSDFRSPLYWSSKVRISNGWFSDPHFFITKIFQSIRFFFVYFW